MTDRCRSACGALLMLPILIGLIAAPAAADQPLGASLTYEQAEDKASFIDLVRKARQGDTESQWQAGAIYVRLGAYARAIPMLRLAADAGHPRAETLLGRLYEEGRGTEKDIAEAKRWYRFAVEHGESEAMAALGRLLLNETGPDVRSMARQLFQQAAQLGDPDGQYYFGWTLMQAQDASRDEKQAYSWFVKAANQGHVGAQLAVATHLMKGWGVAKDRKAAGEWLLRAAQTQDPVAHYLLGRWRADVNDGERDRNAAQSAFRVAASAGHREAQFELAVLLAKSSADVDRKDAAQWFAKADQTGHKEAANRLGELLRGGGAPVLQNLDKARIIFQRAAERGNVNAMYNLAQMLNDGLGGQRDTDAALRWYARAAEAGHEQASEIVGGLLGSSVKASSLGFKGFWQ